MKKTILIIILILSACDDLTAKSEKMAFYDEIQENYFNCLEYETPTICKNEFLQGGF